MPEPTVASKGGIFLFVGSPKTGKTVSACTFPKPMLVFDFDDGVKAAYAARDAAGQPVVSDSGGITTIPFFIQNFWPLTFLTPSDKHFKGAAEAPPHAKEALNLMVKFDEYMKQLFDTGTVTIDGKTVGPFQTVVVDPLTQVFRMWQDAILAHNNIPTLRIQDYKTLEGLLYRQFIPKLKAVHSSKIPWVVLTAHTDSDKDEASGAVIEFPVGPSKAMGRQISEAFDEIYLQTKSGSDIVWRTRSYGRFESAGSRHHVPEIIKPATFAELSKHFR
jgi:hypothetical protein